MSASSHNLPLQGVKVIDFSRAFPGPWCTQTLGDLGANVIKIEQPGLGDFTRHNPPTDKAVSVYFNGLNRNKRSIALDLHTEADRAIAYQLVDSADIVVKPFRANGADKTWNRLQNDFKTQARYRNPR